MGIIDLVADTNDKLYGEFVLSLAEQDLTQDEMNIRKENYLKGNVISYDMAIRREAFKRELLDKYRKHYREEIDTGNFDELFPILKTIRDKDDDKFKSNFLFITVNPKPAILLPEFMNICSKVMTKPWINKYLYVLEQRGENDDDTGRGFHFHCLIDKGDYRFSHARREFVSSFRKICDTQNYHTFNFAYCKEIDIKKRQNYMIGEKADPDKHLKQAYDKKWRKIYNIPDYYGDTFI